MTHYLSPTVTIMEVIMWIKTCEGEFLNSDYIDSIKLIGVGTYARVNGNTTFTTIDHTSDVRHEIVNAIVTGVEFVEVK